MINEAKREYKKLFREEAPYVIEAYLEIIIPILKDVWDNYAIPLEAKTIVKVFDIDLDKPLSDVIFMFLEYKGTFRFESNKIPWQNVNSFNLNTTWPIWLRMATQDKVYPDYISYDNKRSWPPGENYKDKPNNMFLAKEMIELEIHNFINYTLGQRTSTRDFTDFNRILNNLETTDKDKFLSYLRSKIQESHIFDENELKIRCTLQQLALFSNEISDMGIQYYKRAILQNVNNADQWPDSWNLTLGAREVKEEIMQRVGLINSFFVGQKNIFPSIEELKDLFEGRANKTGLKKIILLYTIPMYIKNKYGRIYGSDEKYLAQFFSTLITNYVNAFRE